MWLMIYCVHRHCQSIMLCLGFINVLIHHWCWKVTESCFHFGSQGEEAVMYFLLSADFVCMCVYVQYSTCHHKWILCVFVVLSASHNISTCPHSAVLLSSRLISIHLFLHNIHCWSYNNSLAMQYSICTLLAWPSSETVIVQYMNNLNIRQIRSISYSLSSKNCCMSKPNLSLLYLP